MQLQFLGAAQTVTGSCYLLDNSKHKVLVDCGMFQGNKEIKERNYQDFIINPGEIDFVLLTHAHIDHSGLIPKLVKHGFKGEIITTSPSMDLCEIMLPDSAHIQETEVERKNRKYARAGKKILEPIYNVTDAINSLKHFRRIHYRQLLSLTPEMTVRFQDAGHILGSAMLEVWVKDGDKEIKLVFSGDIGNYHQPLINDPAVIDTADYVIMESTYGNRFHAHRGNNIDLLKQVINEAFAKKGNLIIPAFAIERTQDLLYDLSILISRGDVKPAGVYIDSPLAISATEIFRLNKDQYFDPETNELMNKGINPLDFPGLTFTRTAEESKLLNNLRSKNIIIAGSGMCEAGRIKHHLKHHLWKPESTILFVGYQAEGTLGRRIVEGEKQLRIHGEEVTVKADIKSIPGFSAHADQPALVEWIKDYKNSPKTVFLVHGEPEATQALKEVIEKETKVNEVIIPTWKQTVEITPPVTERPSDLCYTMPEPTHVEIQQVYNELQTKLQELIAMDLTKGNIPDTLTEITELKQRVDEILKTRQERKEVAS